MTLTAGVWAPGRNFNEERSRMNNVLKGRWTLPSLCLNKMMKDVMKAYLHGKIDELADSLEGEVAQSIHSCILGLDSSEPEPLGEYWNMKWKSGLHQTDPIFGCVLLLWHSGYICTWMPISTAPPWSCLLKAAVWTVLWGPNLATDLGCSRLKVILV